MSKFLKQKNKGRQSLSSSKGFTLLETLVAISIFTVSLLGIISVLASSISDTTYAKQKMTATYLAQEGVEYIRNLRDTYVLFHDSATDSSIIDSTNKQQGWNNFKSVTTNASTFHSAFPTTSDFSSFYRAISVTIIPLGSSPNSANEVRISSTVTWTTGSGTRSVTFSEDLFNWIQ